MSNFFILSYFQTFLLLGVEQGLQKLPKYDIYDLRLLFHCYILIPRKCPCKTPFKTQCPPPPLYNSDVIYGWPQRLCRPPNAQNIYLPILYVHLDRGTTTRWVRYLLKIYPLLINLECPEIQRHLATKIYNIVSSI